MADRCPYLEYQPLESRDSERPYCTVVDEFVQPMRADICNCRYDLDYEQHCEYYREQRGLDDDV